MHKKPLGQLREASFLYRAARAHPCKIRLGANVETQVSRMEEHAWIYAESAPVPFSTNIFFDRTTNNNPRRIKAWASFELQVFFIAQRVGIYAESAPGPVSRVRFFRSNSGRDHMQYQPLGLLRKSGFSDGTAREKRCRISPWALRGLDVLIAQRVGNYAESLPTPI